MKMHTQRGRHSFMVFPEIILLAGSIVLLLHAAISFVGIFPTPAHSSYISVDNYNPIIQRASVIYGVDVALIKSVIERESKFDPYAVSSKGAKGLMQLMPSTAKLYGVKNPYNPVENIMTGTFHLRYLIDKYKGNLTLAIAAYNGGESAVSNNKYKDNPAIQEYIKNIKKKSRSKT